MTELCEHGAEKRDRKWDGFPSGMAMAMPYGTCACCSSDFWYCDCSMMYGSREGLISEGTRWTPANRCEECGGHYERYREVLHAEPEPPALTIQERLAAYKAQKRG